MICGIAPLTRNACGLFCFQEDPGNVAPGSFCVSRPVLQTDEQTGIGNTARHQLDRNHQNDRIHPNHGSNSAAYVLAGTEEEPT